MRRIEIFRLRRVRHKAAALALLSHAHHADGAPLTPDSARTLLHAALGGARPVLALPDDARALACLRALAACGLVGRFAATDGFDSAGHAHAALQAAWPQLAQPVADTVAALLLQEQWPAALEHALWHLRMHAPTHANARQRLEHAATACGVLIGEAGKAA